MSQLGKAQRATDLANIRSAYAEATTNALLDDSNSGSSNSFTIVSDCKFTDDELNGITWIDTTGLKKLTKGSYKVTVDASKNPAEVKVTSASSSNTGSENNG